MVSTERRGNLPVCCLLCWWQTCHVRDAAAGPETPTRGILSGLRSGLVSAMTMLTPAMSTPSASGEPASPLVVRWSSLALASQKRWGEVSTSSPAVAAVLSLVRAVQGPQQAFSRLHGKAHNPAGLHNPPHVDSARISDYHVTSQSAERWLAWLDLECHLNK